MIVSDGVARTTGFGSIRSYDLSRLPSTRVTATRFGLLPAWVQYRLLRFIDPVSEQEFHNVVTIGHHEAAAQLFDPNSQVSWAARYMAVGTGTTPATGADRSLSAEGYRTTLSDATSVDNMLYTTAFLSTGEANDLDPDDNFIREIGLATAADPDEGKLLSHVVVDPEPKSPESVVSINYTLKYT